MPATTRRPRGVKTRPKAEDYAKRFIIYVNPLTTKEDDPLLKEQRALPHLENWFMQNTEYDNVLKRKILEAVLFYVEHDPAMVEARLHRALVENESSAIADRVVDKLEARFSALLDSKLTNLQLSANHHNTLSGFSTETLDDDTDEFFASFLDYEDEPEDS